MFYYEFCEVFNNAFFIEHLLNLTLMMSCSKLIMSSKTLTKLKYLRNNLFSNFISRGNCLGYLLKKDFLKFPITV